MTKALYDRLDGDDLRALEAAFDAQTAAYWANADPAVRPYLTLHFGAYHGVTQILDKTGLSASMPPDDVHAMARGPVAAGGDPYIADLVVEAVERSGRQPATGDAGARLRLLVGPRRADARRGAAGCGVERLRPERGRGRLGVRASARHRVLRQPAGAAARAPDGALDLVYAISIWSHFDADAGLRWFDEMHRLLRPGGLLVVTTHGLSSLGPQIEGRCDGAGGGAGLLRSALSAAVSGTRRCSGRTATTA